MDKLQLRKKRCETRCQQHKLSITSLHYPKLNAETTFCPKYHREPRQPQDTYPTFNSDMKYYTEAFILGCDRRALSRNDKQEIIQYNKMLKDQDKGGKIVFPRPHKRHTTCCVCRSKYKNYLKHIMGEDHKTKINSNLYNEFILQLTDNFKHMHVAAAPCPIDLIDIKHLRTAEESQNKIHQYYNGSKQDIDRKNARAQILQKAKATKIISKQIVQYIISSDEEQNSVSSSKHNDSSLNRSSSLSSSSSSSRYSSSSSSSSSQNDNDSQSNEIKRVQQINLDSDSSVQIITMKEVRKYEKQKKSKKIKKSKKQKKSHKRKHRKDKHKRRHSKKSRKHRKRQELRLRQRQRSISPVKDKNKKKIIQIANKKKMPETINIQNSKRCHKKKVISTVIPATTVITPVETEVIIKNQIVYPLPQRRLHNLDDLVSNHIKQKIGTLSQNMQVVELDGPAITIAKPTINVQPNLNSPFLPSNLKQNLLSKNVNDFGYGVQPNSLNYSQAIDTNKSVTAGKSNLQSLVKSRIIGNSTKTNILTQSQVSIDKAITQPTNSESSKPALKQIKILQLQRNIEPSIAVSQARSTVSQLISRQSTQATSQISLADILRMQQNKQKKKSVIDLSTISNSKTQIQSKHNNSVKPNSSINGKGYQYLIRRQKKDRITGSKERQHSHGRKKHVNNNLQPNFIKKGKINIDDDEIQEVKKKKKNVMELQLIKQYQEKKQEKKNDAMTVSEITNKKSINTENNQEPNKQISDLFSQSLSQHQVFTCPDPQNQAVVGQKNHQGSSILEYLTDFCNNDEKGFSPLLMPKVFTSLDSTNDKQVMPQLNLSHRQGQNVATNNETKGK